MVPKSLNNPLLVISLLEFKNGQSLLLCKAVIIAAHIELLKEVKRKGGLDYLQVFEIDGERLWFIDDVTHVIGVGAIGRWLALQLTAFDRQLAIALPEVNGCSIR